MRIFTVTFWTTGNISQEAAQSSNVHFGESIETDEIILKLGLGGSILL